MTQGARSEATVSTTPSPAGCLSAQDYLTRMRALVPGGVNSPVRAYAAVGGDPVVIAEGHGSRVHAADGAEYLDYVCSWGPLILGHAPPAVVRAVQEAAVRGLSFGAPTPSELDLAERVVARMPCVEMLRCVVSGTEATMSALRLARAATGRAEVLKFAGCYHGHVDALLVSAGSGVATLWIGDARAMSGVPDAYAALTRVARYNDVDGAREVIRRHASDLACVIVEPVAANMGVVPPRPGFLEMLREETQAAGALLIFDEVITGFRLGPGGASALYGVPPDLVTLGKILGGGLPIGAYGGRADLMRRVAPLGDVYQAGTLAGNPVAMSAGCATLDALTPAVYGALEERARALEAGLRDVAKRAGAVIALQRVGSLLTVFFTSGPVTDYDTAARSDTRVFARFFHAMRRRGVLLPPSQFEAWCVSCAHSPADVEETVRASYDAFREACA
jgi:glutamate-1-semialdehyde 2,1-aminomutase